MTTPTPMADALRHHWPRRLLHGLGVVFCAVLGASMLLFPIIKHQLSGLAPVAGGLLLSAVFLHGSFRRKLSHALLAPRRGRFLLVTVATALLLRAGYCVVFQHEPGSDQKFYHTAAVDLLEGKGYLYNGSQPTAFYPPGNSMILAGWYAITTPHYLSGWARNILLGGLLVALTYIFCLRAFGELAARWAAMLMAIHPVAIGASAGLGYETALSCLLLGAMLLALRAGTRPGGGLPPALAAGLMLGLGCLIKPICLLVPLILVATWLIMGVGWRSVVLGVLCSVAMAAVVAPWTIRNYRVFGEFVPVSTNGGNVLYTANNPDSKGIYMRIEASPQEKDPDTGLIDEVKRDRRRRAMAVAWITSHPLDWIALWPYKTTFTWGSMAGLSGSARFGSAAEMATKGILNASWALLLPAVVVGTLKRKAWASPRFVPMALLIAYVLVLHLFFEAGCRHALITLPGIMAVAAAGLAGTPSGTATAGGPKLQITSTK